jgi:hypothetical protein
MVFAIREVLWLCAADGGGQSANEKNGADSASAGHDSFLSLYTSQERGTDALLSPRPDYLAGGAHSVVYASWLAVIGLGETTARPIQP